MTEPVITRSYPKKPRGFVAKGEHLRTIAVRFDHETFRRIAGAATTHGVSFATEVRKLVEKGMEQ